MAFVCANWCVCVRWDAILGFPSPLTALKLMIWGPKNQQIWPPAGYNGEHDLPVDVFEDCSSFFSVSTSLPPHNRRIHGANSHATPAFAASARKARCRAVVDVCTLIDL